jgi:hypothetical protein
MRVVQCRMEQQVTRRLILGCLAIAPARAQTQKPGTTIHFDVDYKTTPERIY